jgi:hypothetical protein
MHLGRESMFIYNIPGRARDLLPLLRATSRVHAPRRDKGQKAAAPVGRRAQPFLGKKHHPAIEDVLSGSAPETFTRESFPFFFSEGIEDAR